MKYSNDSAGNWGSADGLDMKVQELVNEVLPPVSFTVSKERSIAISRRIKKMETVCTVHDAVFRCLEEEYQLGSDDRSVERWTSFWLSLFIKHKGI